MFFESGNEVVVKGGEVEGNIGVETLDFHSGILRGRPKIYK